MNHEYGKDVMTILLGSCLVLMSVLQASGAVCVRETLEQSVANGDVAGVVSIYSGPDYVEKVDCVGFADIAKRRAMSLDTVFAIFSSSKSVCGTAIMILIGEGKLSLDDSVSRYLPEFADVKVEEADAGGSVRLVAPRRPVTVRDLMAHTSGSRLEQPIVHRDYPLRLAARWMASIPFKAHPGETFSYNNAGIDAGGAIVEVVSGMEYERFCEERIFKPLGMKDTTFHPSKEHISRMARCYNGDGRQLVEQCEGGGRQTVFPPDGLTVYPAPSAGLYSTPRDFIKYSQMLAHRGSWKNVTIIPRKLFDEVFVVKQTPAGIREPYTVGNWIRGDWLGHSGALKTDQRANFKTGHCRLFFVQVQPPGGEGFERCKDAWNIVLDEIQGKEGASPCLDFSTQRTSGKGTSLPGR